MACHLKNASTYILVGVPNRLSDPFEGDVVRGEFVGVETDLVFTLEPTDGGHLGDPFNRFQGIA